MLSTSWRKLFWVLVLVHLTTPGFGQMVLRVCDDVEEPTSLNPYRVFSEKVITIIQQFIEGLVRFDSEGNLESGLAEKWTRINDKTVRFYLRKNVEFHNGEKFGAHCVKYSIEKYIDPDTKYPGAGYLNVISQVNVIDENTIDIITNVPDGLILNRLAAFGKIVPCKYYTEVGADVFAKLPVGTGPFEFKSWNPGKEIEMIAFKKYWNPSYPKVDTLKFKFVAADDQVDALFANEVDILTSLPGTRTLDVQKDPDTTVVKRPTFYTVAGAFNTSRLPLSNRQVRQALNMAIDKEAIIRYDLLGNGRPIATLTMPFEFGHNDQLEPYPYDIEGARDILKEQYPNGFTLRVFMKVNAQRTGQVLTQQLAKIGVQLESTLVTDAEIFKYLEDKNQWDILLADCPNPFYHSFFIQSAFLYSKSPFALSKNEGFDSRLEKGMSTLDPAQQKKAFEDLDKYVYDQALCLFTYQRIRTYGLRRGVKFTPYVSGMPYFHDALIKSEKMIGVTKSSPLP